ncbi:MAG: calcineurin-like phosphoesterase family protein [Bacteroidales bacterium]|nr:calcineurin-like phosphoesterase family protein [Bacteroidales bacterium]
MRMFRTMLAAALACMCLSASAGVFDRPFDKLKDVRGVVTDTDGHRLPGIMITDGYGVYTTDENGEYFFTRHPSAAYVYYSIPAEYEVPMRQGHPCFYKKLSDVDMSYDFILKPLKGGKEKAFNLFFVADPQMQNIHHVDRFRTEGVPDWKAYGKKMKDNCYGITLGDIGYTEKGRNTNYLLPIIREEMSAEKTGMPTFQTVGNHDFEFAMGGLNEFSPTVTIRRDRMFEAIFGPIDYSWNRGDAHIISMNNVQFDNLENAGKYTGGFTDEQLEWLRQDLALVPKDKIVIFCAHIPLWNKKSASLHKAIEMLGGFAESYIFTGHTHTNFKHVCENGVKEITVGAMSGCWWWSRNCADGAPNGYLVCHITGNHLDSHLYKSLGYKENVQMRIYRGDAEYGGDFERFKLQYDHNTLLINIWNYDDDWKVDVYENGKFTQSLSGPMTPTGEWVPEQGGTKDWWAIGYNVGVVGRGHAKGSTRNNYCSRNDHMFIYQMRDPSAKVKVVITDGSGKKFTETHIFETAEYDKYAAPPAYAPSQVW